MHLGVFASHLHFVRDCMYNLIRNYALMHKKNINPIPLTYSDLVYCGCEKNSDIHAFLYVKYFYAI